MAVRLTEESESGYGDWNTVVATLSFFILLVSFVHTAQVIAPGTSYPWFIGIALFLIETWFAVAIHELGHAVAARAIGRRTHIIAALPVTFLVRRKKFVFSRAWGVRDVGGFVLATPPLGGDWRRGEAVFTLAGVAANAISGLAAFVIASSGSLGDSLDEIVGAFGLVSVVMAAVNLIPTWEGPLRNDGAHLIDIFRGRVDHVSERFAWLAAMNADGFPTPKDWNAELVRQIEADVQNGHGSDGIYALLLQRYLGLGDVTRARAAIDRVREHSDGLRIDYAFLLAIVDRDGKAARALLDTIKPKLRDKTYNYWRALATACDVAGDLQGARSAVANARKVAARTKAALDDDDHKLLAEIEQRASVQVAA